MTIFNNQTNTCFTCGMGINLTTNNSSQTKDETTYNKSLVKQAGFSKINKKSFSKINKKSFSTTAYFMLDESSNDDDKSSEIPSLKESRAVGK